MIQRFQIEDIIAQDATGVIFRAHDAVTDTTVALRRLFPFGRDGEGLSEEAQVAYRIASERMLEIQHPGLRSVIHAGCDPVDGMPYIATEWIHGVTLRTHLGGRTITHTAAIDLLTRALDVCELLSRVLAEEAVWIETDLESIVIGEPETGRGATFWVAPIKWFSPEGRNLDTIVQLTERLMGWEGQLVGDQAGRGLGGWLKWLRTAAPTTTLNEAREMLAASTGMEPPIPPKNLVRQATRPVVPAARKKAPKPKRRRINGLVVTIILLCLITGGLAAWAILKTRNAPLTTGGLAALVAETPLAPSDGLSAEMREVSRALNGTSPTSSTPAFAPEDDSIRAQAGKTVSLEGTLNKILPTSNGKSLYLLFQPDPDSPNTRGTILISRANPSLSADSLAPLVGRKIRITGILSLQETPSGTRAEIAIDQRTSIKEAQQ